MSMIEQTQQLYMDVLATAAEGGIDYWCDWVRSSRTAPNAEYLALHGCRDAETGERVQDITLDMVRLGMRRIADGEQSVTVSSHTRAAVVSALGDPGSADIDAEAADCIVQVGLFGEIVYG